MTELRDSPILRDLESGKSHLIHCATSYLYDRRHPWPERATLFTEYDLEKCAMDLEERTLEDWKTLAEEDIIWLNRLKPDELRALNAGYAEHVGWYSPIRPVELKTLSPQDTDQPGGTKRNKG